MLSTFIDRVFGKRRSAPSVTPSAKLNPVTWKGTMSPFSTERLQWIEGRLFCLARMARNNAGEGAKRANMHLTSEPREAHLLMTEALKQINVERLLLLAERDVIHEYNQEQLTKGA